MLLVELTKALQLHHYSTSPVAFQSCLKPLRTCETYSRPLGLMVKLKLLTQYCSN